MYPIVFGPIRPLAACWSSPAGRLLFGLLFGLVVLDGPAKAAEPTTSIEFRNDYRTAVDEANHEKKMVLIVFHRPDERPRWESALERLGEQPQTSAALSQHVVAIVEHDYELTSATTAKDATAKEAGAKAAAAEPAARRRLLDHAAFAEMLGQPGCAVIDFRERASRHYQHVVSVLPTGDSALSEQKLVEQLGELVRLPSGSLTQRSLIFAVRTHPARPRSTRGERSGVLVDEAESHAAYQASIRVQGHHQWETRFHRINAKLPGGLLAQEVCAESWPGQTLLEAARECVHSWSQSPGHWSAVSGEHPLYGYDMKRGGNGVWYGVGIFGRAGQGG